MEGGGGLTPCAINVYGHIPIVGPYPHPHYRVRLGLGLGPPPPYFGGGEFKKNRF